jgi:uncharacterized membrane protein YfcA
MNPLFLALVGFFSGLTASMGLGGGFVLLICFSLFTELPQLENQLMNLIFFLPIALFSVILHAKHRLIDKQVVWKAVLAGIAGVLIGTLLSQWLEEALLSKLFGALIVLVGLRELFYKESKLSAQSDETSGLSD